MGREAAPGRMGLPWCKDKESAGAFPDADVHAFRLFFGEKPNFFLNAAEKCWSDEYPSS